jgi:predicted O-methyltransferase YrrM
MSMLRKKWKAIRSSSIGRLVNVPVRFVRALPVAARPLTALVIWSFTSREDTNFTYRLTGLNEKYLAHAVALATGASWQEARLYIEEAKSDDVLIQHILSHTKLGPDKAYSDMRADLHKRLGWYAVVRILQPQLIVETGVDKGLGTVVLAAAVLKNGKGRVVGTDINPSAGALLNGQYRTVAEIMYGDSIKSLEKLTDIDLFINDSDHSSQYEMAEYQTIANRLSSKAILIADNAHAATALMDWAESHGWRFLFWKEEPLQHWYPGAGIGFAFRPEVTHST